MKKIFHSIKEFAGMDSQFEILPNGYINKTVCGCGLTTVALENKVDTIIAVPSIYLAINKTKQYPNERCSYKVLAVWGDTTTNEISDYINNNDIIKIMVVYDSLYKVEKLLPKCKLVIDESNELLSKTKLKPEVIDYVFKISEQYKESVTFISATPTPLEYLPSWIADIDQVDILWGNTRKATPIICERTYPFKSLREEFIIPLRDSKSITVANKTFSKIIVFVNTVVQISELVKEAKLNKEECGIICGDSLKNDIKIVNLKRYDSGELPKFLFITSSGFCGIDLSDDNAMTIVVSNTAKKWQMIDMLTDLKQAVSRQRNKNNPNYGSYIYIYNQTLFAKTEKELLIILNDTYDKIQKTIKMYDWAKSTNNIEGFVPYPDFLAYTLFKNDRYIINEQAFQADKYFILEIKKQYTKGFDIKGSFSDNVDIIIPPIELSNNITYKDLVKYFNENNIKGNIDWGIHSTKNEWINIIEASYKLHKKTWVDISYAKEMIYSSKDNYELIKISIKKLFSTGGKYSRKYIKEHLQKLYDEKGINRKAKHTDLQEVFSKIKEITIKGERMVEIISK